jgi:hypothetical protein
MTADRDATRIVRSWLEAGVTTLPDRVLDAVLDQVPATPQRRAGWLARRFPTMNNTTIRFGVAAVAVVVLVLLGVRFLPGTGTGGGPSPTPRATPTLVPSPEPSEAGWLSGTLGSGRVQATNEGVRFSFVTPEGWVRTEFDSMIRKLDSSAGYPWIGFINPFDSVATDPCAGEATRVGPTVNDLATGLTTIPGTSADAPVNATVGGLPAKLVVLSIDDDVPCPPNSFWLYGPDSAYPNSTGSTIKVWIFELDGERYVIHVDETVPGDEIAQEIQQIIDSIRFE